MDVVNHVVLVGAGTRVPKVQEHLKKFVGQELAKNLNTDEAAAMGAVYKAADLSTGFKVAKFITKDAVVYPVQVSVSLFDLNVIFGIFLFFWIAEHESEGNTFFWQNTCKNGYFLKKITRKLYNFTDFPLMA